MLNNGKFQLIVNIGGDSVYIHNVLTGEHNNPMVLSAIERFKYFVVCDHTYISSLVSFQMLKLACHPHRILLLTWIIYRQ
jgi:hypothetical protein